MSGSWKEIDDLIRSRRRSVTVPLGKSPSSKTMDSFIRRAAGRVVADDGEQRRDEQGRFVPDDA